MTTAKHSSVKAKARTLSFWGRNLSLAIIVLLLLLTTTCVWLLGTGIGTRVLVTQASAYVPQLSVQKVTGALSKQVVLENVRWQSANLSLKIEQLRIVPKLNCLWQLTLCIDDLSIRNPHITLTTRVAPEDRESESASSFPLSIRLAKVELTELELQYRSQLGDPQHNALNVGLDRLAVKQVSFNNDLYIGSVHAGVLVLRQGRQVSSQAVPLDIAALRSWRYQPPDLTPFLLPLAVSLDEFVVDSFRLERDGMEPLVLGSMMAGLNLQPSAIQLKLQQLDWQNWRASAALDLDSDYHLQLQANAREKPDYVAVAGARSAFIQEPPLSISLQSQGSLDQVGIEAQLLGADGNQLASLQVRANPEQAKLPLEVGAQWAALGIVAFDQAMQTQGGKLSVTGDMDEYQLAIALGAMVADEPVKLAIEASASGLGTDNKQIQVASLDLDSSMGTVKANALFKLQDKVEWQTEALANNLAFFELLPASWQQWQPVFKELSGADDTPAFNTEIKLLGSLDGAKNIEVGADITANTIWQQKPVALDTNLILNGNIASLGQARFAIPHLAFTTPANTLMLEGALAQQQIQALRANLDFNDLAELLPGGSGRLLARLNASGPLTRPNLNLNLEAEQLGWQQMLSESLLFEFGVDWAKPDAIQLSGSVETLQINPDLVLNGSLNSSGSLAQHTVNLHASSQNVSAKLSLDGSLASEHWLGQISSGEVSREPHRFQLEGTPAISLHWQPLALSLGAHCWRHLQASVCNDDLALSEGILTGSFVGHNLPLMQWLKGAHPWLRETETDSLLSFSSQLAWHLEGFPTASLSASFSPGSWRFEEGAGYSNIQVFTLSGKLSERQLSSRLEIDSPELGSLGTGFEWRPKPTPAQQGMVEFLENLYSKSEWTARLEAGALDLEPIAQFMPQLQASQGKISGHLIAQGQGFEFNLPPLVNGDVSLVDAEFVTEQLGIRVNDANQRLSFKGASASLEGGFLLGGGEASLSGAIEWHDQVNGQFSLVGNGLGYQDNNLSNLLMSPDLTLTILGDELSLKGSLEVPSATITVQQLPETARLASADVQLLGNPERPQTASSPLALDVSLQINTARNSNVNLTAFGLETGFAGNLLVTGTSNRVLLNGEVSLIDGKYQAWGQELLVKEGDLVFTGPPESPYLYAEAIRDPAYTQDGVTAGVRIEGSLRKPTLGIFATPDMSQSQALSYLLRGRSLSTGQVGSEESMFTNMLLGFGLNKSEDRISKLGRNLGVRDLSLGLDGNGSEARVSVSGSVAPGLQLSYGVGVFDAISEVTMRYQLLPQVYLEAVSGLNSAVDIYFEFDDEPAPAQPMQGKQQR